MNSKLCKTAVLPWTFSWLLPSLLLLVVLPAGCSSADEHSDPRAQEIVDQMIEAHGGIEAWRALQDITYGDRRIRFRGDPSNPSVSERDIYLKRNEDGRLMMRIEIEGGHLERLGEDGFPHGVPVEGTVTMGYDGNEFWELQNGQRVTDPEVLESTRFVMMAWRYWFCIPFVLKDPGVRLSYEGEDEIEGRPVHLIEVTFAAGTGDNPEDRYMYYINRDTHMVENLRYWLKNRERYREFRMRDYVPVADFLHDTLRLYHNHLGEYIGDREFEILAVNSGLSDDLFKPDVSR